MRNVKLLAAATILAVGASAASAQNQFEMFAEVEGWKVWKDNEKGSCFIERRDEAGSVVQMGLTADKTLGYVGAFTQAETDIKDGEIQEIQIIVGDHYYKGESESMRGNLSNGYTGGYFMSPSAQLLEDIAKQYVMTIFPETDYALEINLDGTLKATESAHECNQTF
ncbi:hypothetical protein ACFE33_12055 [Falsihalocynthiibacter sp. SS001]|uniref:hypothetical protein n=1 Tax=Falsihalocynthiibacter sp. SS001 TaxID=3349698 RepID=UPI0036D23DE8